MSHQVLRVSDCHIQSLQKLLKKYQLTLQLIESKDDIPGSYWGDSEAGLIGNKVYVRQDTPVHSLLHETCHYICMDQSRREALNTDAAGDYDEENGVCYLQILLSDDIPEMGRQRMFTDMDSWGYTFRLGSAQRWFEEDAEDAYNWLKQFGIIKENKVSYQLRVL